MTESTPKSSSLMTLAAEVADFWQDHLSKATSDPAAKAEMMKLMEPTRQMFAEWTQKMQNNPHGTKPHEDGTIADPTAGYVSTPGSSGTASTRPSSDDYALRLAQLAHRVAELEKRIIKLETRPRRSSQRPSGSTRKS